MILSSKCLYYFIDDRSNCIAHKHNDHQTMRCHSLNPFFSICIPFSVPRHAREAFASVFLPTVFRS